MIKTNAPRGMSTAELTKFCQVNLKNPKALSTVGLGTQDAQTYVRAYPQHLAVQP